MRDELPMDPGTGAFERHAPGRISMWQQNSNDTCWNQRMDEHMFTASHDLYCNSVLSNLFAQLSASCGLSRWESMSILSIFPQVLHHSAGCCDIHGLSERIATTTPVAASTAVPVPDTWRTASSLGSDRDLTIKLLEISLDEL